MATSRLPRLLRLSLGEEATDHTIYAILPSTLTHLTVAIPAQHEDPRLGEVEVALRTRLHRLVKLELYSRTHFPSPEIAYSRPTETEVSSLRELRLSHIDATTQELTSLLNSVESTIQTLAFHHVLADGLLDALSGCASLRRLELGRLDIEVDDHSLADPPSHPYLRSLRLHFSSSIPPMDIIRILKTPRLGGRYLESLELVGVLPCDIVKRTWSDAKIMDRLIRVAERKGTIFMINGRMIETMGDLWVTVIG